MNYIRDILGIQFKFNLIFSEKIYFLSEDMILFGLKVDYIGIIDALFLNAVLIYGLR